MSNRIVLLLLLGLTLFLSAVTLSAGGNSPVLAGGQMHSIVLASDGTVWTWGAAERPDQSSGTRPAQVRHPGGVVAVVGGGFRSMALKMDGTVWYLSGDQEPAQVSGLPRTVAVAAGGYSSSHSIGMDDVALTDDGNVWTLLDPGRPAPISGLTGITAIAVGFDHRLALKGDGTVWAWGSNTCGQSGDGSPWGTTAPWTQPVLVSGLSDVVAVSAGGGEHFFTFGHSLALKSDGTVWEWGCNGEARPQPTPRQVAGLTGVIAVAAGDEHSLALKGDGTVWAWGVDDLSDGSGAVHPDPVQVNGLTGVVAIAAGGAHSLALKDDGTVWAWGFNGYGQLGDGTTADRPEPVQVDGLPPVLSGPPAIAALLNAASFQQGPIAPGEVVSIFGAQMGPVVGIGGKPGGDGGFETTLGETRVLFDGVASSILFARADQVNAVVPAAVAGKQTTDLQVEYRGVKSSSFTVPVAESAPGVFTVGSTGSGQGLILNDDGGLNSASEPARRSSIVNLFATGEGQTPLTLSVNIGGQETEMVEAAAMEGLPGVLRVSVRIPEGVNPGPAVPIILAVGENHSQEGVTVAIQ